jgi:hypothetical protein
MKIILNSALPDVPGGAEPPQWVHLVPSGTFQGTDGRGPYILRNAMSVITASMAGGKLPIDENHATDYAVATGQPSPARGWITDMQSRADGIWGRVTWTPSGLQLMREGAYRGFSPVLAIDASDKTTVKQVLRGALTNTPNLGALTALHALGGASTGAELTADDRYVCHKMGVDPSKLAAHKLARSDGPDKFGLTDEELAVCRKMSVAPKMFAAHKRIRELQGSASLKPLPQKM